jgi:ribosome recycling factor
MIADVLHTAEDKMAKAIQAQERELSTVRTGRATPAVLANIKADYHGTPTPLSQMATITVPEARLLVIQPWERQLIPNIEKAILASELGINPSNDGVVVRLAFPQLTQERRMDLAKLVKKHVEDGKIALRNVRREAQDELKNMEKKKEISADEQARASDQLQKLLDAHSTQLDQLGKAKEAELMEI